MDPGLMPPRKLGTRFKRHGGMALRKQKDLLDLLAGCGCQEASKWLGRSNWRAGSPSVPICTSDCTTQRSRKSTLYRQTYICLFVKIRIVTTKGLYTKRNIEMSSVKMLSHEVICRRGPNGAEMNFPCL